MNWLLDLVWVGNTLYPRWFVFAIFIVLLIIPATLISWILLR